ncbi:migration and invasion-inhibitory protein [Puntigrus tetrazona]|uniref:migration and invasion-inhibitory protein n=1 Tax=Puntigrus tetrazona TaxID=1606681 RepID=UPI001C89CAD7|nr:migration and invasion-inhibitory protein [Puntigrus tetrazona]
MAAFKQIDSLRKRNKYLLDKLEKQSDKLRQLTLSCPDKVDKCHSLIYGDSGPRRAPLTERNGAHPPRAGASLSPVKTVSKSDELQRNCEDPTTDHQLKPSPSQSSELNTYSTLLEDAANSRRKGQSRSVRLMLPKSATFTACDQKENDSSTAAGLEMDAESERNIQTLLGYDWIAGLLDAKSCLEDRSEQFFSDLHSFRQANRDECTHNLLSGCPSVTDLASSTLDSKELQTSADAHQCTFCYRINSRLFAAPLDAQVACPVCKMPKSDHPHTEKEPAVIRISIPRSTLLPAYKYKAHRRCSFDPSDSLGLPSHCLSGWSNPTLNAGSQMSSLDLRGYMAKPAAIAGSASSWFGHERESSFSNALRHPHSDQLQNLVCLPRYRFQHSDPKRTEPHSYSLD